MGFTLSGSLPTPLAGGRSPALDGWLFTSADINFLHVAALLSVVCSAVLIVVADIWVHFFG